MKAENITNEESPIQNEEAPQRAATPQASATGSNDIAPLSGVKENPPQKAVIAPEVGSGDITGQEWPQKTATDPLSGKKPKKGFINTVKSIFYFKKKKDQT